MNKEIEFAVFMTLKQARQPAMTADLMRSESWLKTIL
jgi:hypothetical protein